MDFKCADGVGNTLQIFQSADTSNNAPVVVFVPAMGIPARKYDAFCNAMADYGVNVACFDVRGLVIVRFVYPGLSIFLMQQWSSKNTALPLDL